MGECVLISAYLINRTPYKVINNGTPYQRLYGQIPHYSHLRSFGCLVYASTLPRNCLKFDPRARICIILGYHPNMETYKLLDFHTKHIFYSTNVIFHEQNFLFLSLNTNPTHSDLFHDVVLPHSFSDQDIGTETNISNSIPPQPSDSILTQDYILIQVQREHLLPETGNLRRTTISSHPPSYL